ncbi:farnesylcysteine lyase [Cynara cardunculus var. scolymus]|uniref:Prenylcysteine lyase n=1 Tax=Cynara cardunculus var. scolymus TaxID=59895 RepID=A0A118K0G9_CYNCS|nr:farnesylcysteine lyase [Cynara cardunculus var. scolymus]KVI00496.1 Prenylcysteine lyase [Cynara cardunculus var. scolymus]
MFTAVLIILSLFSLTIPSSSSSDQQPQTTADVCIIGTGIAGSSVSHFLRQYSPTIAQIRMFERHPVVGGRMATVTIAGETFEAGASILHPKNYHALNFTHMLNLKVKGPSPSENSFSLGIWDGQQFVFKTIDSKSKSQLVQYLVSLANSIRMFIRYGISLLKMTGFVEVTVDNFLKYYESRESRPIFSNVEDMLKWAGLYNLTTQTLEDELVGLKYSPLLIQELITVITRINYGQSVRISGLAGAVSLAGSGGDLWAVEGGNWQMAAGLVNRSDVTLHLQEEIVSVTNLGGFYELNSTQGNSYTCQVTVVATPLDELNIQFTPVISIPERKLQHTHATFVRGLLNHAYFGLDAVSDIPELVGTIESPKLPFTCISVLKEHSAEDMTYKMFSRQSLTDTLLDQIFSTRKETLRINWGAYPHYHAPEKFAPFMLDDMHLYYVNAFENAASTMETSAVAAENIARLIISRLSGQQQPMSLYGLKTSTSDSNLQHPEL